MDWNEAGIITIVLLIISLCIIIILKVSTPISVDLNGYTMQKSDVMQGDVQDFVTVGTRFAATHAGMYSNANGSKYTCVNYTNDLEKIAKELGFKVERVDGWENKNETGHSWLRLSVDYEPQAGTFVDYSKTYPIQEVKG
jgi:hypothetical protein